MSKIKWIEAGEYKDIKYHKWCLLQRVYHKEELFLLDMDYWIKQLCCENKI